MFDPGNAADVGNLLRQGAGRIPGSVEPGDRFGSAIVRADGGVAIGAPREDAGSIAGAGHVTLVQIGCAGRFGGDMIVGGARAFNQNTPGVPGRAESGDRLGATLSLPGFFAPLVVSAPGESLGAASGAGLVHFFVSENGRLRIRSGQAFTQNSPGVPGRAEHGDSFGLGF